MSISVNNALQAALLQNTSASGSTSGSASNAFNTALMEALSENSVSEGTDQSVQPEASSTYALLSCLLGSGLNSSSNMMLLSLCSALYGDGSISMPQAINAYGSVNAMGFNGYSGSGNIPAEPWKPTQPAVTSNAVNRSASQYTSVINQFNVEGNERYQPDGGTYCNIFVWDVTSAMGAEIPHYYDADTGTPMKYGDKGATQMNANGMYKWLHEHGDQYGWFEVTPEEAQQMANSGHPVVTARYRDGAHGHVQVVCPSKDGVYDEQRGVTIAQAGRHLSSYKPITQVYGASLSKVSYFAHM